MKEFGVLFGPHRAQAWLGKVVRYFQPSITRSTGQWEELSPLQAGAQVHLECQVEGRVEEGLRRTPAGAGELVPQTTHPTGTTGRGW